MHIFKGGEGYQAFNVDVAVELCREVRVVWDNPSIINHNPINLIFLAIIRSVIKWVAFSTNACVRLKSLREMFCALSVLETPITTAMDHTPFYSLKQHRLCLGIWPVCPDCGVDVSGGKNLLSVFEED